MAAREMRSLFRRLRLSGPTALTGPLSRKRQNALLAAALIGLVFLAHGLGLWADFIWDDFELITRNPLIHSSTGLWRFWFSTQNPDYFPLSSTTWWIEWRLWGLHPAGYHFFNILLHATSAVLIWQILHELELPGAWLTAAIWAVHPVQVESVAWIAERKNTLSLCLAGASMLLLLRFYRTNRVNILIASLAAFTAALLAKTAVAPLPIVMLGCAIWRQRPIKKTLVELAPFALITAALCAATLFFQSQRAIASDRVRDDGMASRIAIAGRAIWFYLSKLIWPMPLDFVYPRWPIGIVSPQAFIPLALFILLLLILWIGRRRWGWKPLLAMGYFLLMLLPVLGLINIYFMRYSLVADHWQYAASIGPIALFSILITRAGLRVRKIVGTVVITLLVILSNRQTLLYHTGESLWKDTIAKNPSCWMAYMNLGHTMIAEHRYAEAEENYRDAAALAPDLPEPFYSLGSAEASQGNFSAALPEYQRAIQIDPKVAVVYLDMGECLASLNQPDQAIASFEKAIQLRPDDVNARYQLGVLLEHLQRPDEAIKAYESAVAIEPDYAVAQYNLGHCLIVAHRYEEATAHLREAILAVPDWAEAHANLAYSLHMQGQSEEAASENAEARRLDPGLAARAAMHGQ